MKKEISQDRQFLINRLGYIRNRAGLSARDLSLQLDNSDAYISKYENGDFNMPTEVLLNAINICGSTPEEFFYENINDYNEHKEVLKLYNLLSTTSKETIKDLMKNMK